MTHETQQRKQLPEQRACILHAEDDHFTSVSIARLLTVKGFNVETATNGLEALNKFLERSPAYDLIITDQSMPAMTGVEWLKKIRATGFSGKIIVYAATLPGELTSQLRELGVDRILSKSASLQSLLDTIQALLMETCIAKGDAHGLES